MDSTAGERDISGHGKNLLILKVPIQTMHAHHNSFIVPGIAAPT